LHVTPAFANSVASNDRSSPADVVRTRVPQRGAAILSAGMLEAATVFSGKKLWRKFFQLRAAIGKVYKRRTLAGVPAYKSAS
jgi:hypothetical protein